MISEEYHERICNSYTEQVKTCRTEYLNVMRRIVEVEETVVITNLDKTPIELDEIIKHLNYIRFGIGLHNNEDE